MRYSDQPIRRPADDKLGRTNFALRLAHAIDSIPVARDGFVMALVGPWGSGKTSAIELICRYLKHLDMSRGAAKLIPDRIGATVSVDELETMAVIFDQVEHLVLAEETIGNDTTKWERCHQLREFTKQLGSADDAEAAIAYWRLLRDCRTSSKVTVVRFSPWLISGRAEMSSALLSELARASGHQLGPNLQRAFANLIKRLAEFGPVAGAGLDLASGGFGGALLGAGIDLSAKMAH